VLGLAVGGPRYPVVLRHFTYSRKLITVEGSPDGAPSAILLTDAGGVRTLIRLFEPTTIEPWGTGAQDERRRAEHHRAQRVADDHDPRLRILVIVDDQPYGSERPYNALSLAGALAKRDEVELRVFLRGDAAACAVGGPARARGPLPPRPHARASWRALGGRLVVRGRPRDKQLSGVEAGEPASLIVASNARASRQGRRVRSGAGTEWLRGRARPATGRHRRRTLARSSRA
jgi:hypothetical protein